MKRWLPLVLMVLTILACSEPDPPNIELYLAVDRGDLDQVERHLYWGTEINTRNPDGEMPLHVAAMQGRAVIAERLLNHGAEVEAKDAAGHSPLYVALEAGRTQIAELLLEHGANLDPDRMLLQMVRAGVADRDVIEFLVERGANPDFRGAEGWTPLTLAVNQRDRKLARFLIDAQADVNVPNGEGEGPLAIARRTGREDIISLLQRHGAMVQGESRARVGRRGEP